MITEHQIEVAARIMEPNAWALHDHGMSNPVWGDAPRQVSLDRAREIAAIFDPKPSRQS